MYTSHSKLLCGLIEPGFEIVPQLFNLKADLSETINLAEKFPEITWIMWDERLSSKRAQVAKVGGKKKKTSEDKLKEHAIAAAFILDLYLTSCIVVRDEYDYDCDDDINDIHA